MNDMLHWIQVIFLGTLQGITETFPISSSGHLALVPSFFPNVSLDLAFATILHLGSLAAIVYWTRVDLRLFSKRLFRNVPFLLKGGREGYFTMLPENKLPVHLGLSLAATMIVGFILRGYADAAFSSETVSLTPWFLLINGVVLIVASATSGNRTLEELTIREYIIIGTIHGLAVIPGLSRLGLMLFIILIFKVGWYDALRLVFLLAIPTILGGVVIQLWNLDLLRTTYSLWQTIVGILVAAVSSFLGLRFLTYSLLKRRSLQTFGYYCIMIGAFTLVYRLFPIN